MTKTEKSQITLALHSAFRAAELATNEYLTKYPDNWFPCGFAWVRFPGRSPVIKVLKEDFVGRSGHKGYPKGWDVWNPSGNSTQCMEAKVAGAQAFAEVMTKLGYECYSDCRMD